MAHNAQDTERAEKSYWGDGILEEDQKKLDNASKSKDELVLESPIRLGYFAIFCLVVNRMVGTGIFNSASVVFQNTQSVGLSLIFWTYGACLAISGIAVYIELGLTIPRFLIRGEWKETPRSGGELNYLVYIFKTPRFLAACFYGISFVILGNTAANSVAFGSNVILASGITLTAGRVCAVAVSVNTFCCLLHSISRRWGIYLINLFGVIKFSMLIFFIIIGVAWGNKEVAEKNFNHTTSFNMTESPTRPFSYAEAIIFVMFPYSGFHQVNYVLAEIDKPHKKFKWAAGISVTVISVLFVIINVVYASVIPPEKLFSGVDIGNTLFHLTIGRTIKNPNHTIRFYNGLKAMSGIGNIIVVTFTAARVKQEIAKEGILPYSLWFANSYDLSLKTLYRKLRRKERNNLTESTESTGQGLHWHSEKTPAATMVFHWIITNLFIIPAIFILQPTPYSSGPAYTFLITFYDYVLDVFWFAMTGLSLVYLRLLSKSHQWRSVSKFPHWLSTSAALIFSLLNMFPVIGIWMYDPRIPYMTQTSSLVKWYVGATIGLVVLGLAVVYWAGFRLYLHARSRREGKSLVVERTPIIREEADRKSYIQLYEIVKLQWKRD